MKCEIVGDCEGCKVSFFFSELVLYVLYLLLALTYIYCILYQYLICRVMFTMMNE